MMARLQENEISYLPCVFIPSIVSSNTKTKVRKSNNDASSGKKDDVQCKTLYSVRNIPKLFPYICANFFSYYTCKFHFRMQFWLLTKLYTKIFVSEIWISYFNLRSFLVLNLVSGDLECRTQTSIKFSTEAPTMHFLSSFYVRNVSRSERWLLNVEKRFLTEERNSRGSLKEELCGLATCRCHHLLSPFFM